MVGQLRPKYKNLDRFPLEEYYLRPLVTTFFGKTVDVNFSTRMGDSYDWFYKNLKNADETISIRNFIDLIKLAVESAVPQIQSDKPKPILLPIYYTNRNNRKEAVKRQFNDLWHGRRIARFRIRIRVKRRKQLAEPEAGFARNRIVPSTHGLATL